MEQLQSRSASVPDGLKETLSSLSELQPAVIPKGTRTDYGRKVKVICHHCKRPGHVKMNCFEIIGYPPGWQQRQQNRPFGCDNRETRQNKVHFISAASTGKWGAARGMNDSHRKKKYTADSWIIDSGATNHMSGSPKIFSSYMPQSGRDKVRIADGTTTSIMGCGTANTSSLLLDPVLHVPNFPVNLLSVSSITKSLNCRVSFEPESCMFQDLKSGKILGTGVEHDGLYYLDENTAPFALSAASSTSIEFFGCTCFVHDYRPSVGKLDPRAIKCIFVGYSPTQKGYRC